jgi:hypothetical protein
VTKPKQGEDHDSTTNHKRLDGEGQAIIEELLQERLRLAIKYTLVQVLEEEVEAFVNTALTKEHPNDAINAMGSMSAIWSL